MKWFFYGKLKTPEIEGGSTRNDSMYFVKVPGPSSFFNSTTVVTSPGHTTSHTIGLLLLDRLSLVLTRLHDSRNTLFFTEELQECLNINFS